MAKFTLVINCDNAAFDDRNIEVGRILRKLADRIERDQFIDGSPLMDVNGNRCGVAQFDGLPAVNPLKPVRTFSEER